MHLTRSTWVCCLLLTVALGRDAAGEPGVLKDRVECVTASRVVIDYGVRPGQSLDRVDLWYTQDRGKTWAKAELTEAVPKPIVFEVPTDGLFGFYLVLHGPKGSGSPPEAGVAPQRWIRVDRQVPVIKLLELRKDPRFDLNREVRIRWHVEDAGLPQRPAALSYRSEEMRSFKLIEDSLEARASYRWVVPEHVTGEVKLRITAVDRAGYRGYYESDRLLIEPDAIKADSDAAAPQKKSQPNRVLSGIGIHSEPDAGRRPVNSGAASEAIKQYDLGTWHRLRGEHDVALMRYGQALEISPGFLEARNDLAGLLFVAGDMSGAEREYLEILKADSKFGAALKGLALVQAKRRAYRSAHETLQKLLLLDPGDAEARLHFGDVCLFMGDRRAAREAWTRLADAREAPELMRQRAVKRLKIYQADRLALDAAVER